MQNLSQDSSTRTISPSAAPAEREPSPQPDLVPSEEGTRALLRVMEEERRARTTAEAAAEWMAFLESASRTLASSLGYRATLKLVAELVVPRMADWCMVDLLQPDGSARRLAVAHADPLRRELARALHRDRPAGSPAPGWVERVARTGKAKRGRVTDRLLQRVALDPQHLDSLRSLRAGAYICVPLLARQRTLGTMLLIAAESGRVYGEEDLQRAQALADHVALAIDNARLHQAEQEARRRAERMQQLSAALSAAVTSEEVGAAVMEAGVSALSAYAGVVALTSEDASELEILASLGYQGCMQPGQRWPLGASIPVAEATRTGEPVFVESPEAWSRRYTGGAAPAPSRSAAWAAIPLLRPGRATTLGALLWAFERERRFDSDDRALFEALARQCVQALERARLHEAEQRARLSAERAANRLHRLQATTAALSEALTPDEVATVVVDQGIAAVGAQAGSIAVLDAEGTQLDVVRAIGYTPEVRDRFRVVPLSASLPLADCVRDGRFIFLRNAAERDACYPHLADVRRANSGGAMAAVPLVARERVLGALGLNFPSSLEVQEEDLAFILALAQQCAQALDRSRLYEAERAARAEAEQANRAKAQFLSTMSHELRTPLNAIGGYTDLLQMEVRGPVNEQQRADLVRIRRNQRHLLTLINDVLNFARVEAGHVELSLQDVPLSTLLDDLEQLVLPQLQAKELCYTWRGSDDALIVRADPDKAQQILINLVSNAIKFSPVGGCIEVDASATADAVTVRVRDQGPGIPADQLERVFDPFVQLGRGLTSAHEGTGLGLSISRDLARAMDGELLARSTPGEGATFSLTLPHA